MARRTGRQLQNANHSSLCSTAMRKSGVDALRSLARPGTQFIDLGLWRYRGLSKKLVDTHNVVGIKGLPGRGGIGMGHRESFNGTFDFSLDLLRSWIGEDCEVYREHYKSG